MPNPQTNCLKADGGRLGDINWRSATFDRKARNFRSAGTEDVEVNPAGRGSRSGEAEWIDRFGRFESEYQRVGRLRGLSLYFRMESSRHEDPALLYIIFYCRQK